MTFAHDRGGLPLVEHVHPCVSAVSWAEFRYVHTVLVGWSMENLPCSPANHARLNVENDWEFRFWCAHLCVRPKVLREAVDAVGSHLGDVVNYLARPPAVSP